MTLKDDLRHEKNMSATWEKLAHANKDRAEKMEQRAEAAEARALSAENLWHLAESERDEARRQLTEAQHAIDAMAQIVGSADTVRRQLEQARSDIEDYRIRVNELLEACKAARDWFNRNTLQGHTPGPVEKMLIDSISEIEVTA